jgi:uncharacterized iron-regulated membrane protein
MKRIRTVFFWLHLAAGVSAGLVILVMSATGAVLAFKPQILNRVERDVRFVEPEDGDRLPASRLIAAARVLRPGGTPVSLALDRDASAAAAVSFGRDGTVYVNPYSGSVLGQGSVRTQQFFRSVENWHRWLAVDGDNRAAGRSITGAANFLFLGLAISGLFLWWPHKWLPQHMKAILFFRRTSTGRARDFNWHNVIGFWCAPVIIVMTATGAVMSYPWANRLLYQVAGSPVPGDRRAGGPGEAGRGENIERRAPALSESLDEFWARAEQQMPSWRTITMRLPERPGAPVSFTMTDSQSWNAFARSQLAVDASSGEVVRWEPYDGTTCGQKWRGWVRFGHTGELGGITGQTLAGVASFGGVVLVWTGFALALRRLIGWRVWSRVSRSPAAAPNLVAE